MKIAYKLRHRIDIQEIDFVIDSNTGARVQSWTSILEVLEPASIVSASGREFITSQANQQQITTKITIRYRSDIKPTMRIVYEGNPYTIRAILPDFTDRRYITFLCDSGVSEGG